MTESGRCKICTRFPNACVGSRQHHHQITEVPISFVAEFLDVKQNGYVSCLNYKHTDIKPYQYHLACVGLSSSSRGWTCEVCLSNVGGLKCKCAWDGQSQPMPQPPPNLLPYLFSSKVEMNAARTTGRGTLLLYPLTSLISWLLLKSLSLSYCSAWRIYMIYHIWISARLHKDSPPSPYQPYEKKVHPISHYISTTLLVPPMFCCKLVGVPPLVFLDCCSFCLCVSVVGQPLLADSTVLGAWRMCTSLAEGVFLKAFSTLYYHSFAYSGMCDEWLTTPSSKAWNHEESSEDNRSQWGGQGHRGLTQWPGPQAIQRQRCGTTQWWELHLGVW